MNSDGIRQRALEQCIECWNICSLLWQVFYVLMIYLKGRKIKHYQYLIFLILETWFSVFPKAFVFETSQLPWLCFIFNVCTGEILIKIHSQVNKYLPSKDKHVLLSLKVFSVKFWRIVHIGAYEVKEMSHKNKLIKMPYNSFAQVAGNADLDIQPQETTVALDDANPK